MNNIQLTITENQAIKIKRLLTVMVAEWRRRLNTQVIYIKYDNLNQQLRKDISDAQALITKIDKSESTHRANP